MRTTLPLLLLVSLFVSATSAQTLPTLRVIDWNVHHSGIGTDGVQDMARIVSWLTPRSPHVISLNEISAAAASDMKQRLETATGVPWYSVQFGAAGAEGEAIVTRYPIVSSTIHWMADGVRHAGQATLDVNGRQVNVFTTHLQNGDFPAIRQSQIAELITFAAGFAEPRLIAGDINAAPDYTEIQPLFSGYIDSWENARQHGAASAYADNPVSLFTRTQWKRIDHILASAQSGMSSNACEIPDQRDLANTAVAVTIGTTDDRGVRPSDHNLLFCSLTMGPPPAAGDTTPPQVSFASPPASDPVTYVIPFVASASDDRGVAKVEFRVDSILVNVDRWAPFEYAWRTDSAGVGNHTIDVTAFDAAGNQQTVRRTYTVSDPAGTTTDELVMYAADSLVRVGAWNVVSDANAAGGKRLDNPDAGAAKVDTPSAAPLNYFELSFPANAGQPYHLWLRGRASGNSDANDSVYVQFSDSITSNGAPAWLIGSSSAQAIVLEDYAGAGLSEWGWQDNGFGADMLGPPIYFATTGLHTLRIQVREDGLSVDQVMLSTAHYAATAPGGTKNDHTFMNRSALQPPTNPLPPPPPPPPPPPSNHPPTVTLTAPANGTTFLDTASITVSADAADSDGTIARVEFYAGKKLIGSDTIAPFSIAWTGAAVGNTSLTAKAIDNNGAATTSATVTVQIKKAPKK